MENDSVELRTLRKERRGCMQYVFSLRARGAIGAYVSEAGYAAYCPAEVEEFQKNSHVGRPVSRKKKPDNLNGYDDTITMLENLAAEIARNKKGE